MPRPRPFKFWCRGVLGGKRDQTPQNSLFRGIQKIYNLHGPFIFQTHILTELNCCAVLSGERENMRIGNNMREKEKTLPNGAHWLIQIFQLDLLLKDAGGGDTTSFVKNGEWDLIGSPFLLYNDDVMMWSLRNGGTYQVCVYETFEIQLGKSHIFPEIYAISMHTMWFPLLNCDKN